MLRRYLKYTVFWSILIGLSTAVSAQEQSKSFKIEAGALVEVTNPNGLITVSSVEEGETDLNVKFVSKDYPDAKIEAKVVRGGLRIHVPSTERRIDVEVSAPETVRLRLESRAGQITVSGSFLETVASTDTGTIYADTVFSNLKYKMLWTASYPRYLSDVEIAPIREKAAGKYVIEGIVKAKPDVTANSDKDTENKESALTQPRSIYLRTARGIILLNVPPSQVPNDLLPKKLTNAARSIIQSGDSVLVNAIRRSSPALFSDYKAYSPNRAQPVLIGSRQNAVVNSGIKRVTVQVTDSNNRAIGGLKVGDFVVTERGIERNILDIQQATTPFNLLLILDVSGSVENHVDFIRKAARSFVNTVDKADRISIVTFNDDVKTLSGFTADKNELSDSLDSFDAGGGTALYDAIAYGLVDSLKPFKGDRTAIVILSDGDDNRSFLPFESLIGSLEESGALVYPMYVPSSLIAASGDYLAADSLDPLRDRYLTNNLSSKAEEEGERLAQISGGVYFPISRLSELQKAYNDIVVQLRTAYTITFRSNESTIFGNRASPRLKVSVKKDNAFVRLGPVSGAVVK